MKKLMLVLVLICASLCCADYDNVQVSVGIENGDIYRCNNATIHVHENVVWTGDKYTIYCHDKKKVGATCNITKRDIKYIYIHKNKRRK